MSGAEEDYQKWIDEKREREATRASRLKRRRIIRIIKRARESILWIIAVAGFIISLVKK